MSILSEELNYNGNVNINGNNKTNNFNNRISIDVKNKISNSNINNNKMSLGPSIQVNHFVIEDNSKTNKLKLHRYNSQRSIKGNINFNENNDTTTDKPLVIFQRNQKAKFATLKESQPFNLVESDTKSKDNFIKTSILTSSQSNKFKNVHDNNYNKKLISDMKAYRVEEESPVINLYRKCDKFYDFKKKMFKEKLKIQDNLANIGMIQRNNKNILKSYTALLIRNQNKEKN